MFVDDHGEMYGGLINTVTVRLSTEEAQELIGGKMLRASNKSGNKLQVIVMIEDNPKSTSAS